jgi:ribosomal protein S18 acetylase RimI-like enzyme
MGYRESTSKEIDAKEINALRSTVGWILLPEEKWREILSRSDFVFTIWDGKKLIGMGRELEDGYMCMLYDIILDDGYRKMGLGKRIVRALVDHARRDGCVSIKLIVEKKNAGALIPYYKKLGFVEIGTGMRFKDNYAKG